MATKFSQVQTLRVERDQDGQRLDNFLLRHLKGVPRPRVYNIVRRGEVRVNKKRCKPNQRLAFGDRVRIPPYEGVTGRMPGTPSAELRERLLGRVVHEDAALLALDKPAGLAVHGGSGIGLGLVEALRQLQPQWARLELAHRLDRETSGILLLAKEGTALKHLQDQFRDRSVAKTYLALVHGRWDAETVLVNAPLRRNVLASGERIVRVAADGKPSQTRFAVKAAYPAATLLEARPVSGRTHQIRVHCLHEGHPVVGDRRYGKPVSQPLLRRPGRLCLHALQVQFRHPLDDRPMTLDAPLDSGFQGLLDALAR